MTESTNTPLRELLDRFASPAPLPGGGSAAALTGALGVSLLLMVAKMDKTRSNTAQERADLDEAATRLHPVRDELTALIDDDSRAYLEVIAAYRQPRTTEAEQRHRRAAIQAALQAATNAPLRTMRACELALSEAPLVVRVGNPNAATDAAVGARLLLGALEGAGLNVDVNLPGITDQEYVHRASDERRTLQARARRLIAQ
jgi:formiminotetrahydrofolate cyclodeaminase